MRKALGFFTALIALAAASWGADFRFAILGDRTGGANGAVYEQVWREIDAERPAFVINVGDTIQGGNDARAEAEWQAVRRAWSRYSIPLYFTPGNHDIWSEASRQVYQRQTGRPAFYSFDFGGAHFTVLDNSLELALSDAQMQFLERDLEAHRSLAPKFVFFHKPFWLAFLKLGSGEFPLHKLARKHGVTAVVSGHGHQLVALQRDGVRYLEVGSSGAHFEPPVSGDGFDQGWFYHHVVVDVQGGQARFTVKEAAPRYGRGRTFPVMFGTE
jgi:predicted phosphodiesterase